MDRKIKFHNIMHDKAIAKQFGIMGKMLEQPLELLLIMCKLVAEQSENDCLI